MGVSVTYYDPLATLDELDALTTDTTRVVYLETPGSLTFEMQDIPAIAAWAQDRGIRTIIDNTWATGLYFKPLDHGIDISTHAATKYMCGHSDVISGAIVCNKETALAVEATRDQLGLAMPPDEAYLGLRGLRTMAVRLPVHWQNGLKLASYLAGREEVSNVLHPAMEQDPGHAIWSRDFHRGVGPVLGGPAQRYLSWEQTERVSWARSSFMAWATAGAAFESLCACCRSPKTRPDRSANGRDRASAHGYVLRFHAGLEDADDLID